MSSGESLQVDETVARLATVYVAVGPRLGCCLVEAQVLLLLAGLRAQTELLLYEPEAGDAAAVTQLNLAGVGVRARIVEEDTITPGRGRRVRVLVLESLAGYAYVSERTRMRGIQPFDLASGWDGLEVWGKAAFDALKAIYEPEPVLLDRWIGLVLGYPDCAVEDACEALARGRRLATLARAGIPAVYHYGGAMPLFSFAPAHTNDPGIVATCAAWQALLEGVYASAWHQQLVADPAFQAARRARREPLPTRGRVPGAFAAHEEAPPLSQERLAQLIHEQTAALAALERRISTQEAILGILRELALKELTLAQALGILSEQSEQTLDPEQQALYQQAMDALRQVQAEEP